MMNPNPTCKNDNCRFSFGMSMTTAMYFAPVYDKHGNNVNPDGNTTSGSVTCSTCNKQWSYCVQYDKTQFTEIENGK